MNINTSVIWGSVEINEKEYELCLKGTMYF